MMIPLAAKMVVARRGRPQRRKPYVGKCHLAWKAMPRLEFQIVMMVVPARLVVVVVVVKVLVTVLIVVVVVV